jgi:hypothetical protein
MQDATWQRSPVFHALDEFELTDIQGGHHRQYRLTKDFVKRGPGLIICTDVDERDLNLSYRLGSSLFAMSLGDATAGG